MKSLHEKLGYSVCSLQTLLQTTAPDANGTAMKDATHDVTQNTHHRGETKGAAYQPARTLRALHVCVTPLSLCVTLPH